MDTFVGCRLLYILAVYLLNDLFARLFQYDCLSAFVAAPCTRVTPLCKLSSATGFLGLPFGIGGSGPVEEFFFSGGRCCAEMSAFLLFFVQNLGYFGHPFRNKLDAVVEKAGFAFLVFRDSEGNRLVRICVLGSLSIKSLNIYLTPIELLHVRRCGGLRCRSGKLERPGWSLWGYWCEI